VPVDGQPLWLPEDRAAVLALQEWEDSRCSGCSLDLDESTARDNQFAYQWEPVRCHACKAKSDALERFTSDKGVERGGDPAGVLWRLSG
jgi:hypothetical protein